jgi:hypothetical protein
MNCHHIYQGDMILNKKKNLIPASSNGPNEKSQVKITRKPTQQTQSKSGRN